MAGSGWTERTVAAALGALLWCWLAVAAAAQGFTVPDGHPLAAANAALDAGRTRDGIEAALAAARGPLLSAIVDADPSESDAAFYDYAFAFLMAGAAARTEGDLLAAAEAFDHAARLIPPDMADAAALAADLRLAADAAAAAAEEAYATGPYRETRQPTPIPFEAEIEAVAALAMAGRDEEALRFVAALEARPTLGGAEILLELGELPRAAHAAARAIRAARADRPMRVEAPADVRRLLALARLDGFDPVLLDVVGGVDIGAPLPDPDPDPPGVPLQAALAALPAETPALMRAAAAADAGDWTAVAEAASAVVRAADDRSRTDAGLYATDLLVRAALAEGDPRRAITQANLAVGFAADLDGAGSMRAVRPLVLRARAAEAAFRFQNAADDLLAAAAILAGAAADDPLRPDAATERTIAARAVRLSTRAPNFGRALPAARRWVALARLGGSGADLATALEAAGAAAAAAGAHDDAGRFLDEAVQIRRSSGSPAEIAAALLLDARADAAAGRTAAGGRGLRDALAEADRAGTDAGAAAVRTEILRSLALVELAAGRIEAAGLAARAVEAIGIADRVSDPPPVRLARQRALAVLGVTRAATSPEAAATAEAEAIQAGVWRTTSYRLSSDFFFVNDRPVDLATLSLQVAVTLRRSQAWDPATGVSNASPDTSLAVNLSIDAGRVALQYGAASPIASELAAVLGEVERRAGRPLEALDRLVNQLDRMAGGAGDLPAVRARLAAAAARIFHDEGEIAAALAYARDAVASEVRARDATGLAGPEQLGPAAAGSEAFDVLIRTAYRMASP